MEGNTSSHVTSIVFKANDKQNSLLSFLQTMLTKTLPPSAFLVLILTLQGSTSQSLDKGGKDAIQIVEDNKLLNKADGNAALLETRRKLPATEPKSVTGKNTSLCY